MELFTIMSNPDEVIEGAAWSQVADRIDLVGARRRRGIVNGEWLQVQSHKAPHRYAQLLGDPLSGIVIELGADDIWPARAAHRQDFADETFLPDAYRPWCPTPVATSMMWTVREAATIAWLWLSHGALPTFLGTAPNTGLRDTADP